MKSYSHLTPGFQIQTGTDASGEPLPEYVNIVSGGAWRTDFTVIMDTETGNRSEEHPHEFHKYTGNGGNLQGVFGWYDTAENNRESFQNNGVYGGGSPHYIEDTSFSGDAYNRCIGQAYEAFRGGYGADLSIDLMQLGRTKAMLASSLKSLATWKDTFDRLKRVNPKDVGGKWLEAVYGWLPTASTISSVIKQSMEPSYSYYRVKSDTAYDIIRKTYRDPYGFGAEVYSSSFTSKRSKCVLEFGPKTGAFDEIGAYTSLNPLSIAWELVPYSFVVDWFVDIGGYFRNVENACIFASEFKKGYIVEGVKADLNTIISGSETLGTRTTYINVSSSDHYAKKRRTALFTAPLPQVPVFDPQLGARRLISAASLLSQSVKSWETRLPREHRFR